MRLLLLFLLPFFAVAQKKLVFLGSYNWDKDKPGIYVYELVDGKLAQRSAFTGVMNPSYITLSPDGKYLYACIESKTLGAGSVAAFRVDALSGKLHWINSRRSGGENPVYLQVHPSGKWLVNANYTDGSLSVYPLDEQGAIGEMVQNLHFQEGSVHPIRQERSHVHAAVFSPDGKYLFAPDLGADKIRAYGFDTSAEAPLLAAKDVLTPKGTGPRHFSFHPKGTFAYCIEELGGAVEAYQYSDGQLISLQRVLTHEGPDTLGKESSDLHLSPDGKYLYAANRGTENNLAIFEVGDDGKLEKLGYVPTRGEHPRTFALDAESLLIAHPVSGEVSVFRRPPGEGRLEKEGRNIKIPGVSTVQIRVYNLNENKK